MEIPDVAVSKPAEVIVPAVVVMFPAPDMLPVSVIVSPLGNVIPPFAVKFPVTAKVFPMVTVEAEFPIEIGTTFVPKVAILIAPEAARDAFCPMFTSPLV